MSDYTVSPRARQDLLAIWDYIANKRRSPAAADRQLERLAEKFALLATQPLLGESRDDMRPRLRVFAAGNYVILYYPTEHGVDIAGVAHGAQDIEAMFRRGER